MSIYSVFQAVIVTAIVAYCFVRLMQKLLPAQSHAFQVFISRTLNRKAMPSAVQSLGQKLQPAQAPEVGCASGCGSCKGCSISYEPKG
ncbi:MAG: DUF6587 family protein [Asticcacaulis sp.]